MASTEDDEFLSFTSSPPKVLPLELSNQEEASFEQFTFAPTIPQPTDEQDEFEGFQLSAQPVIQRFEEFTEIQSTQPEQAQNNDQEADDFGDFAEQVQEQKYSLLQLLEHNIQIADDVRLQQLKIERTESLPLIDKAVLTHRSFMASAQLFKWKDSMIRKLALVAVNVPTNIEDGLTQLEATQIIYNRSRSVSVPGSPANLPIKTANSSSPYASRSLEDLTYSEDPFGDRMAQDSIAFSTQNNDDLLGEVTLPMINQQRLLELCTLLPKQIIGHPNINTLVEEYVFIIRDLDIVLRHLEVGKNNLKKTIKQNNVTIQGLVKQMKK